MDQSVTILLVEDERTVARYMEEVLRKTGYIHAGTVTTGNQAIRKCRELHPDLVLMDIFLKGEMDGIDAAAVITEKYDVPVVYLTSHVDEELLSRAKIPGTYGYLVKPCSASELRAGIEIGLYTHASYRKQKHINTLLKAIRNVNQSITRNLEKPALLQLICNELVQPQGFKCACIAMTDPDGTILSSYSSSKKCGKLFGQMLSPELREYLTRNDVYIRAAVETNGIALCRSLCYAENVYGMLCVSISKEFASHEDECMLVDELADDISFALYSLDLNEQRRKVERELRSVFSAAPIGIGSVTNRIITFVNERMCNMVGYSADELIGQSSRILYETQEEYERVGTVKYADIADHGTGSIETQFKHKNGQIIDILLSSTPVDYNDLSKGVTFTALDITERKKAVDELKRAKQDWENIFQAIGQPTMILDPDYTILSANRATLELTGMSAEKLKGSKCYNIFHDTPDAPPGCPLQTIDNQAWPGYREAEVQSMDRYFLVSCTPVLDEHGQVEKIIHIATDITRRKKFEEERQKIQIRLRQAQKMEAIGSLAGGIAHDFNNILFALIGYNTLAKQVVDSTDPVHEYLKEIDKSANRAAALVKHILTFSRQDEQERKPLHLHLVVDETLSMLLRILPPVIEIRKSISKECPAVLADATQIHQVLMNLCTNAYQAMQHDGGILNVTLKPVTITPDMAAKNPELTRGTYVLLRVSDTGKGMDKAMLERIFEPYFTTKDIGEGTGFGLSTVHGIVTSYGGTIQVESVPGTGSTFDVYLPVYAGPLLDGTGDNQV
jgi:PAS domain S-box-containing protein